MKECVREDDDARETYIMKTVKTNQTVADTMRLLLGLVLLVLTGSRVGAQEVTTTYQHSHCYSDASCATDTALPHWAKTINPDGSSEKSNFNADATENTRDHYDLSGQEYKMDSNGWGYPWGFKRLVQVTTMVGTPPTTQFSRASYDYDISGNVTQEEVDFQINSPSDSTE